MTVQVETPEEIELEIIEAECPHCGERFQIPVDILDYFVKTGCAACSVKDDLRREMGR